MTYKRRFLRVFAGCIALLIVCGAQMFAAAQPAKTVTGTYYFADKQFPEFGNLWYEGWSSNLVYAKQDMPLGGYVHIYFKNIANKPVKVTDLTLQGVKMSEALGVTNTPKSLEDKFGSSILLSKLPKEQIDMLKDAGWPVWWKAEPQTIEPGAYGEIVIRLRRSPKPSNLQVRMITDGDVIDTQVDTTKQQPKFESISFEPSLDTIYLYTKHPKGPGIKPSKIFMDDKDITASSTIVSDASMDISAVKVKLSQPLKWMSLHTYRAVYADGSTATAGIRTWGREMVYGMWGASLESGESEQAGRKYLTDWANHNINAQMGHHSGPASDFFNSEKGWEFTKSLGIDRMTTWMSGNGQSLFLFAMDEPDAHDYSFNELPATDRLGAHGQYLVKWTDVLHRKGGDSPVLLNIDNTYKPENWYMYNQISDIPCADPYYPEQLDTAYTRHPSFLGAHTKPTYVYAVSTVSQSSGAPKPLHIILCSTKYKNQKTGYEGRFPTPEEKRMEVYYAIAGGAKGLSYWWFSPDVECIGVGDKSEAAQKLWKEIGLLGAEVRAASPVITTSCPANLKTDASVRLWVRSLISGLDTAAIMVVNNDIASDRVGTVVVPIPKASVTVDIPSWMNPTDAFEVSYEGIKDVTWNKDGQKVKLDLGPVNISRFVIVTANPNLRTQITERLAKLNTKL